MATQSVFMTAEAQSRPVVALPPQANTQTLKLTYLSICTFKQVYVFSVPVKV